MNASKPTNSQISDASEGNEPISEEYLDRLERVTEELTRTMEKTRIAEYVQYLDDRKRLIRNQFLSGLARGAGAAVGFTILGAVFVWLLNRLALQNLPIIGDFLAQLVDIVQNRLE